MSSLRPDRGRILGQLHHRREIAVITIKVLVNVSVEAAINHPAADRPPGRYVWEISLLDWPEELRTELANWTTTRSDEERKYQADVYLTDSNLSFADKRRAVFKQFHAVSSEGIRKLVEDLLAAAQQQENEAAAKKAANQQHDAERAAAKVVARDAAVVELTSMPYAELFKDATILDKQGCYSLNLNHRFRDCTGGWPSLSSSWPSRYGGLAACLIPLTEQIKADVDSRNLEKENQEHAEKVAWITSHGSELLKRMVGEDLLSDRIYVNERLTFERPGWKFVDDYHIREADTLELTLADFQLLDRARKLDPEATLCWYRKRHGAVAKFMDCAIILFGDEEPDDADEPEDDDL